MIVYYSGTGNSRCCAQMLAAQLDDELLDACSYIKNGIAADLRSGRPWVFVCPTYAWRIPRIFQQFLESGSFEGSEQWYFVMTCGGEIGRAGHYLEKLCKKLGKTFMGVLEVRMPENYIALFEVPQPDQAKKIVDAGLRVLEENLHWIREERPFPAEKVDLKGRIKSDVVNHLFYPVIVKDKNFYVTDSCISCGKCAKNCIMNNITMEQGRPVWHGNCTHCMACICACPKEAIEYGKASLGKPRYQCKSWKETQKPET